MQRPGVELVLAICGLILAFSIPAFAIVSSGKIESMDVFLALFNKQAIVFLIFIIGLIAMLFTRKYIVTGDELMVANHWTSRVIYRHKLQALRAIKMVPNSSSFGLVKPYRKIRLEFNDGRVLVVPRSFAGAEELLANLSEKKEVLRGSDQV